jgi:hypothetical protein
LKKRDRHDAAIYYLRLVKHLFRKQRFSVDHSSSDHYIANIPLKVNKNQWELLVNSDINGLNLNEIDSLVEEVLMQSKDVDWELLTLAIIDHYRLVITSFISQTITPFFYCIGALILLFFLYKLFYHKNLTFSALMFFIILIICGISYSMMYLDCMNDLETEHMIKLSMEKSENNPCKNYHREDDSYFGLVKKYFSDSQESKCKEHMRNNFKPSKKYCDPLEVFAKWSAKIHISYLGSIFEEYLELVSKFTSSSNFFIKPILTTVLMIFFGFIVITVLKALIKHGFQGVFGIMKAPINEERRNSTNEKLQQALDALKRDNNEIKRELSILRECSVERDFQKSPEKIKAKKLDAIEETTSSD